MKDSNVMEFGMKSVGWCGRHCMDWLNRPRTGQDIEIDYYKKQRGATRVVGDGR